MSVSLVRVEAPEAGGGGGGDGVVCGPTDADVEVSLPSVLGRGSLLKCGDKKVSRRHAFLDWEENGVQLTAVHQNPTYVLAGSGDTGGRRVEEVTEGSSVLLSHGDRFGLLRDKFWYMIHLPSTLLKDEKEEEPEGEKGGDNEKAKEGVEMDGKKKEEKVTEKEENNEDQETKASGMKGWRERGPKKEEETHPGGHPAEDEGRSESKDQTITSETVVRSEEGEQGTEREDSVLKTVKEDKISQLDENVGVEAGRKGSPHVTPSTSASSSASHTTATSSCVAKREDVKEVLAAMSTKKRRLPQWIMDLNTSSASPSASPTASLTPRTTPSRHHRQKHKKTHEANTAPPPPATPPAAIQDDGEDLFTLTTPSKRRRKAAPNSQSPTKKGKSPSPASVKQKGKGGTHHQMSDESGGEEEPADPSTVTTTTAAAATTMTTTAAASTGDNQISDSEEEEEDRQGIEKATSPPSIASRVSPSRQSAPTAPAPARPSCQYGARCYRKNPLHRQSEAHPGDDDYLSPAGDDSDGDDSRPECEYGVDCYRRNPQHRRDFKHTRLPQPQRKAKRKAKQKKARQAGGGGEGDVNSEEDDYDLDDPFLNDDSSDDYAPTDESSDSAAEPSQGTQEEEEEEDTMRMLKEAKKFVKKRR